MSIMIKASSLRMQASGKQRYVQIDFTEKNYYGQVGPFPPGPSMQFGMPQQTGSEQQGSSGAIVTFTVESGSGCMAMYFGHR
jgi:hypothetical protein